MNREEYERMMKKSLDRRLDISRRKGHDYATEDILSNFKRMAEVIRIFRVDPRTPYGVALIYLLLKLDRLTNLLTRGVTPENEALTDTIDDAKNYLDLFDACFREAQK